MDVTFSTSIYKLIDFIKTLKETYNVVDAKIMLSAYYEKEFGIFDQFNPIKLKSRPLASVALFEEEDINNGSLLEEAMDTYVDMQIHETFFISFFDFISIPRDVCSMLNKASAKRMAKKTKDLDASINALK